MARPSTEPLVCPECGFERVGQALEVEATARGKWVIDRVQASGELPARYFEPSGYTEVHWEHQTVQVQDAYCESCTWEGFSAELIPLSVWQERE